MSDYSKINYPNFRLFKISFVVLEKERLCCISKQILRVVS